MPAGKHSGVRVFITLPVEVGAQYVALARSLDIPLATLVREVLTSAYPAVSQAVDALDALKQHPEQADDILARLLWDSLKQLPRGLQ